MVEQELDDDPCVLAVILDGDHPHDVGRVLRVGVLRILVGQNHNRISIFGLGFTLRINAARIPIPGAFPSQQTPSVNLGSI